MPPSPRTFYIYKITNTANGKVYIGQTCNDVEARWWKHKDNALNKNSKCRFHEAIRKHGPDAFELTVLCECQSLEESNALEEKFISEHNSMDPDVGYNMVSGGSNVVGVTMSPDACKKISESKLGKQLTKRREKTDERDRPLVEAFKQGMTRAEVAEKFGVTACIVSKALHRWKDRHNDETLLIGKEHRDEQALKTFNKTIERRNKPVTDLCDAGMRICDIARELGMGYNLVKQIVRRHRKKKKNEQCCMISLGDRCLESLTSYAG